MPRFYVSSRDISHNKIIVTDKEQLHYMRNVLRLKNKEIVTAFDENAVVYETEMEGLSPHKAVLNIKAVKKSKSSIKTKITIACAIPKKSKIDDIIDGLTQLGVDRIIPLITERVIVSLDKEKKEARLKRWQKIALNASLQSERDSLPVIDQARDFKEALSCLQGFDLKLIPTLLGRRQALKEILEKSQYKDVLLFIGPEGDFTEGEIAQAKEAGCIPVSLGELVLRVETAAIAVASFVRFYAES